LTVLRGTGPLSLQQPGDDPASAARPLTHLSDVLVEVGLVAGPVVSRRLHSELVEVVVPPPHEDLDHPVQFVERAVVFDENAPPDGRLRVEECELEFEDHGRTLWAGRCKRSGDEG
jgi:hypothetical protein